MPDRNTHVVGLHESKRRAWDFKGRIVGQGADDGAGQCRFARAKIALEQQHIAGAQGHGNVLAKALGLSLVRQVQAGWCRTPRLLRRVAQTAEFRLGREKTDDGGALARTGVDAHVPPCNSTKLFTIAKPSPAPRRRPPLLRASKRPKAWSSISCGMPGPSSCTENSVPSFDRAAWSAGPSTWRGAKLAALASRLAST